MASNEVPFDLLDTIQIGDARDLITALPDDSVDMIFTDPVYSQVDDYRWLAEAGARVLRPGKSCLALCGNLEKPRLYDVMRPYLDYFWEGAIIYRGANAFMNSLAIQVSWKPVIWFTKGKREMRWCKDALIETSRPKLYHRWQQSDVAAIWFIRQLTAVGDVVLDPFCGWGAYAIACKKLQRHFVAFELNPLTAEKARELIDRTLVLPISEEVQLKLAQ